MLLIHILFQYIQEVLNNVNWNIEEAEDIVKKNRKRSLKGSSKSSYKKRRKLNAEDADVDSDEVKYKDKVFNRYKDI